MTLKPDEALGDMPVTLLEKPVPVMFEDGIEENCVVGDCEIDSPEAVGVPGEVTVEPRVEERFTVPVMETSSCDEVELCSDETPVAFETVPDEN